MGRLKQILTGKLMFVAISILLQITLIIFMLQRVAKIYYIDYLLNFLSYLIVIYVINQKTNISFKYAWSILILAFPIFGGVLYLLFGGRQVSKKLRLESIKSINETKNLISQEEHVWDNFIKQADSSVKKIFSYGEYEGVFPVYQNTEVTYCPIGEVKWELMLQELKKAKHFILLA